MVNPCIHFALGSHVRFGNLDFICTGVDYDLVLPPNVDIDAISKALSNLHLGTDEGQTPKNDRLGGSQGQTMLGPVARLRPQYVLIYMRGGDFRRSTDSPCAGYHEGTRDYRDSF
jgi:hypothetical protein